MMLKIVFKVPMENARQLSKALKVVVGFPGVVLASIGGANKDQIVVVGEGFDPISLAKSLRKKMGSVEIVAVGHVEEKKKEEKKEEEKTTPPTEAESVDDFRSPSSSIFMEQEEERIQSSNNTSAEEERNPCTSDLAPLHQSEAENDDGLNHSRNPPVQTTTSSLSPFFADDTASGDRADIMEINTGVVVRSADDLDLLFSAFEEIQLPNLQEELTEEQPSVSNSTLLIDSLFKELKTIVLQVDFRGALDKDVESKMLHFCEILHRSALTQAQSNLLDRILAFQGLKSKLYGAIIIQESESSYIGKYDSMKLKVEETKNRAKQRQDRARALRSSVSSIKDDADRIKRQIAKLHEELDALNRRQVDEERELVEIRKMVASDFEEMQTNASWLKIESNKRIAAGNGWKDANERICKGHADWDSIQNGFKQFVFQ